MRTIPVCLFSLMLAASTGAANPSASGLLSEKDAADWKNDLGFLETEIARVHPNPFHAVSRDALHAAFVDLEKRLPKIDRDTAIVGLARVVALLQEGHSQIGLGWDPAIGFGRYPLSLYFFKDGLFVRGAPEALREALGGRVVRIGGMSVEDAATAITPIVQHDNDMTIRDVLPNDLVIPEVLHALGTCPERDRCDFEIVQPSGGRRRLTVHAAAPGASIEWVLANSASKNPLPQYLRNRQKNFWFAPVDGVNALYVAYNAVQDADDETVAQFFDRLFKEAEARGTDYLIVDLRWNNGGDNTLNAPLIRHLAGNKRINRNGHLFVITGRLTFSAAMNCAMDLEKNTAAIFAGEPTGSRPNQYGDAANIDLPRTKIRVRVSTRYWEDGGAADHRPWIAPSISMELGSRDYFENRDPVLDAIVETIRSKPAAASVGLSSSPQPGTPSAAGTPIQEARFVMLGGIEEWITIRGADRANPVLLIVHGGPGDPQSGFRETYAVYEKDFTIVQWDQRGAGNTYAKNPTAAPEPERVESDGIELARYLRGYLGKKKILVLGHSWGSCLAIGMVQRAPELFAAYVGTGQPGSFRASIRAQFDFLLAKARAAGDRKRVEQLEAIGAPDPTDAKKYFSWWSMRNPYMSPDDSRWFDEMRRISKSDPQFTEAYMKSVGDGMGFSGRTTVGAMLTTDLPTTARVLKVPFFVIQGREDMVAPTSVAIAYFDVVQAPKKKLILIDHAGHFALVTHREEFLAALVRYVRPLAVESE